MLCESTFDQVDPAGRVGEPKCILAWQKVFSGRRVALPSKASGPSESKMLKLLLIIFLPALFEGMYSNKLFRAWASNGFCAL